MQKKRIHLMLIARREGMGLTKTQLAELMGVPLKRIGIWESGQSGITMRNAVRLRGILGGVPADYYWKRYTE